MENNSSNQPNFSSSTGIYTSQFPSHHHHPLPPTPSLPAFLLDSPPHPSRAAFIDSSSSQTLTFSDLASLTASISHSLTHSLSVRRNDIVLLISPNSIHFPALSLGIMASGAILSTANHLLTRRELLSQIQDSNPSLILTTQPLFPKLLGLTPRPPVIIDHFLQSLTTTRSTKSLNNQTSDSGAAAVMYSSGTTGRSKGVICTHRNLVHEAGVMRRVWGESEGVYLCVVPMFHMFGFAVFVCGAVAGGKTVVVMERYTVEGVMEAVEKNGVTKIPAVPPMVVQFVRKKEVGRGYNLSTLEEVVCSGAPLGKEWGERFVDCYPGVVLSQVSIVLSFTYIRFEVWGLGFMTPILYI